MPKVANVNHLRFNLQEVRLMSATLPLAVSFDHLRWQRRPIRRQGARRHVSALTTTAQA
jgi:hypothetical protein